MWVTCFFVCNGRDGGNEISTYYVVQITQIIHYYLNATSFASNMLYPIILMIYEWIIYDMVFYPKSHLIVIN